MEFHRGTRAGKFLHKVLESVQFNRTGAESMQEVVGQLLVEYGFEPNWKQTVSEMVQDVLRFPLDRFNPDLALSKIGSGDRLNEMEFNIPLDLLTSKKLRAILKSFSGRDFPLLTPDLLEQLSFAPVRGYMKGFIDLVFSFQGRYYLVDWKSNYLGDCLNDYARERLEEIMWREWYVVQYLLYTAALHRYLDFRLKDYQYERHFGGVFYVFLRGVNLQHGPEYGIYQDLPSGSLVRQLSDSLHHS